MTITDVDGSGDAELGRIFRACLEGLAAIERQYLDNPKRTDEDVQALALQCLGVIGMALMKAKRGGQSPIDADHLPWPLLILTYELHDVFKGRYSALLTPVTQGKNRPKGTPARNRLKAQQRAAAREALPCLEKAWGLTKAASEIAAIFQKQNVKANGKDAITAETVRGWRKQSNKKNQTEADLILEERGERRKAIDVLRKLNSFAVTLDGIYERHVSEGTLQMPDGIYDCYNKEEYAFSIPIGYYEYTDEDRATLLLEDLRRFIAATSYEQ